jgi:hypothetical protein
MQVAGLQEFARTSYIDPAAFCGEAAFDEQ